MDLSEIFLYFQLMRAGMQRLTAYYYIMVWKDLSCKLISESRNSYLRIWQSLYKIRFTVKAGFLKRVDYLAPLEPLRTIPVAITCSKLSIGKIEKAVKYIQI